MANAALVHLYIPPHPSLPNRCENLDMAWIWPPGEKGGLDWGGGQFPSPIASCHVLCFFTFYIFLPLYAIIFLSLFTLLFKFRSVNRGETLYSTWIGLWHFRKLFSTNHKSCLVCVEQHVMNKMFSCETTATHF